MSLPTNVKRRITCHFCDKEDEYPFKYTYLGGFSFNYYDSKNLEENKTYTQYTCDDCFNFYHHQAVTCLNNLDYLKLVDSALPMIELNSLLVELFNSVGPITTKTNFNADEDHVNWDYVWDGYQVSSVSSSFVQYYLKYKRYKFPYNWHHAKQTLGAAMLRAHFENAQIVGQSNEVLKLTKLVFSSSDTSCFINGKSDYAYLKSCVDTIKQIPASKREYDPQSHVWIVPTDSYRTLKELWEQLGIITANRHFEHEVLEDFIDGTEAAKAAAKSKTIPKAEDFFYNASQPSNNSSTMPLTQLEAKLEELFRAIDATIKLATLTPEQKLSIYKKAARRFHPDVNNGDGSRMTELNYLWQNYKTIIGVN